MMNSIVMRETSLGDEIGSESDLHRYAEYRMLIRRTTPF
jgi:hypothetical protein